MRRPLLATAVAVLALTVTACSAPDRTPQIPGPTSPAPASPAAPVKCDNINPLASYPPSSVYSPGHMPANTLMSQIQQRGRLVVGVSSDTRLLGARNLQSNQFEGFDIEMARQVAKAIFGDPARVQFKAISADQRIPLVQNGVAKGGVDMVARAMTVNCARWQQVAFSGVYFQSSLRLLVKNGSPNTSLPALDKAKARVCATSGSTTLAKVRSYKDVDAVPVTLTTDCMVLWQQGSVDAIAGDDAILAGLAEQDPAAAVVGPSNLEQEPYGLAMSKDHKEFVRFVNAVLEQMRKDGTWQAIYNKSAFLGILGSRGQPPANYARPLSS